MYHNDDKRVKNILCVFISEFVSVVMQNTKESSSGVGRNGRSFEFC